MSSRKQLLEDADVELRNIRKSLRESKQNLNEGFFYRVWDKLVDNMKYHKAATSDFKSEFDNDPVTYAVLASPVTSLIAGLLALSYAAASGITSLDSLLRGYFQDRVVNKDLKPIVDELIKDLSTDKSILTSINDIRKINQDIVNTVNDIKNVPKYSKGAPNLRYELRIKNIRLGEQLRVLERNLRNKVGNFMKRVGASKKIMSLLPKDKESFAGSVSDRQYMSRIKDDIIRAIMLTPSELSKMKSDLSNIVDNANT